MKIIVAGAAEVGTHLAKLLARDNKDVTLMDEEPERVEQLTFLNLMTMVGSPTSISALKEAEVSAADLFIAVTPNESVNIHACILAANLGARKTLARIDNYELLKAENRDFYKKIGISQLVYPEMLGGEAVASAIQRPWARTSFELCDGKLLMLMVKVYDGPICGKLLMDIGRSHSEFHIAAIKRQDELIIPNGNTMVMPGDIVYFITPPDKTGHIRNFCNKPERKLNRVVIVGGSRLGIQATKYLPRNMRVLFVENDRHVAERLLELVEGCEVVHGDASDVEFLSELNLSSSDAFVALGNNAGGNVLACLTAKNMGVGKTVAEVEDVSYISLADSLNIGSTVNKKLLTASSIYQLLLDADKTSAKCYSLVDAEVADLMVQPGSKITQKPVMQLGLPKGITIGGMVRNGQGMNVNGQTQFQAGDRVVVVCLNEKINQVEKLFL